MLSFYSEHFRDLTKVNYTDFSYTYGGYLQLVSNVMVYVTYSWPKCQAEITSQVPFPDQVDVVKPKKPGYSEVPTAHRTVDIILHHLFSLSGFFGTSVLQIPSNPDRGFTSSPTTLGPDLILIPHPLQIQEPPLACGWSSDLRIDRWKRIRPSQIGLQSMVCPSYRARLTLSRI